MRSLSRSMLRGGRVAFWWVVVLVAICGCRERGLEEASAPGDPAVTYLAEAQTLRVRLPDGVRITFRRVPPSVHEEAVRHPDLMAYLYASVLRGYLAEWEYPGETPAASPIGQDGQRKEGDATWQR